MPTQLDTDVPEKGLLARVFGVLVSPRATYADIALRPRPWPAIILIVLLGSAATFVFLSTTVGQRAVLDQQLTAMESMGIKVSDQMRDALVQRAGSTPYISAVGGAVMVPLLIAVVAALLLGIFNAMLGGDATFTQVFAVVAYSRFIGVLGTLFSFPLDYIKESMSSPASLAVFFPMIDDATFLGRLLGSIDLFAVWGIVSLSIGLGVLYKKRTAPIAWSLLTFGAVVVIAFAAVRTVLSGA
ncbi:MAG: YIP1 family protein [Acidobacteriaceae bacterium]|jgi:hypothetical protein|nr:YIP1 family protein [Acidobacteriaceae bacterium]